MSEVVCGLSKPFMAELNGRVAIIWVHKDDEEVEADFSKLCMCLISISVNGGFVRGTQEKVEVVDLVPRSYDIYKCIEVLRYLVTRVYFNISMIYLFFEF